MKIQNNSHSFGFTVTELVMALAIMSVALGIGLPNFRSIISRQRLTTVSNGIASTLQLARNEAIKRNTYVGLIPRASGNWESGWIMFVDKNNNETLEEGSGDVILSYYDSLHNIKLTMSPGFSPFYTSTGRIKGIGGNFTVCATADIKDFRKIVIANTGRVRVEKPDGGYDAYLAACPQA